MLLYLIFPSAPVGLSAVVPTGSFNEPVPFISTLPFAVGLSVKLLKLVIVPFLKPNQSIITPVSYTHLRAHET